MFTTSVHAINDDDEVKSAFAEGTDFPWYDRDKDEVQTVDVSAGRRAASIDRGEIPEAGPTTGLNFPGGVSEGASSIFSTAVFIAVMALVAVGIVALLVWAFMKFGNNKSESEKETDEQIEFKPERIEALPFDLQGSAAKGDLLAMARQAYNANDFRSAAIYLYSHVLLSLDHFGWIRLTRGKTNRQYLSELRDQHQMSGFFERLMLGFERAFFGNYQLTREEIDPSWVKIESFQQDVKAAPNR